jgi:hypothetical protein
MKHVRTLIRFTSGYFWPCAAFATVLYCVVPMTLGLATREFFTSLSWTALAVIITVQVVEVLSDLAISRAWSGFSYKTHTLLQRNLMAGILRGFGRHGLPVPPGDALARFREDPAVHHWKVVPILSRPGRHENSPAQEPSSLVAASTRLRSSSARHASDRLDSLRAPPQSHVHVHDFCST